MWRMCWKHARQTPQKSVHKANRINQHFIEHFHTSSWAQLKISINISFCFFFSNHRAKMFNCLNSKNNSDFTIDFFFRNFAWLKIVQRNFWPCSPLEKHFRFHNRFSTLSMRPARRWRRQKSDFVLIRKRKLYGIITWSLGIGISRKVLCEMWNAIRVLRRLGIIIFEGIPPCTTGGISRSEKLDSKGETFANIADVVQDHINDQNGNFLTQKCQWTSMQLGINEKYYLVWLNIFLIFTMKTVQEEIFISIPKKHQISHLSHESFCPRVNRELRGWKSGERSQDMKGRKNVESPIVE